MSSAIFFAGLGLPGLCGFIGEVLVVLAVWKYDITLAVISAAVVILTAGYILWAIQRVYLGAEYKGPHEEALTPITSRELAIAIPLVVLAIWFGVYPRTVLDYMDKTVTRQTQELADWTEKVYDGAGHHEPGVATVNDEDNLDPQARANVLPPAAEKIVMRTGAPSPTAISPSPDVDRLNERSQP